MTIFDPPEKLHFSRYPIEFDKSPKSINWHKSAFLILRFGRFPKTPVFQKIAILLDPQKQRFSSLSIFGIFINFWGFLSIFGFFDIWGVFENHRFLGIIEKWGVFGP